jgi:hypothetical protein
MVGISAVCPSCDRTSVAPPHSPQTTSSAR